MIIDDRFLDTLQRQAKENPRLRMHFDMRNSDKDQSQRILNALEPGTDLPIHRHLLSSETLILLRGRIDEVFYDGEGNETHRVHLNPSQGVYGCNVPVGEWHTVEVYESSVIMEMKNGPYSMEASEFLNS